MDTSGYKDLFVNEAHEILNGLNQSVVDLEKNPDDNECLNGIFRKAHTLKGMAATMGYDEMTRLTHEMESVLDLLRKGKLKADKGTIDLLLESSDMLDRLVDGIASADTAEAAARTGAGPESPEISELAGKLGKIKNCCQEVSAAGGEEKIAVTLEEPDKLEIARARHDGFITYRAVVSLQECVLKEPRAVVVVKALETMGKVIKAPQVYAQLKRGKFGRHFGLFFMTKDNPAHIRENIEAIPEIDKLTMKELAAEEALPADRDVPAKPQAKGGPKIETRMTRISLDKLDSLMDIVGELVINKIRLLNISGPLENKALGEALTQMSQLTNKLQLEMMDVRLVPMDYIFNRFPRMVRDLAAEEKKSIDLVIEGAGIGLDRTIMDEINEPLTHLLRNAVNHGIESPAAREKLGKRPTGTIRLAARRERNYVVIEVSDDGMGIDTEEIRRVAVEKNIVSAHEAAQLSEHDALLLITEAGFSTSGTLTRTSGRGVGMNAVRAKVEAFNGSLTIAGARNLGSRFELKLPLSMAIIQALLAKVGPETCAIPLTNILEVTKIKADSIKIIEHREVVPYRDSVLPLVRLDEKLGFCLPENRGSWGPHAVPGQDGGIPVVVVEFGSKKSGLIVNELLGQREVVIKTLKESIKNVKGIAGATILGDGRVAMILDAASVL